jgi:hypothetical protein
MLNRSREANESSTSREGWRERKTVMGSLGDPVRSVDGDPSTGVARAERENDAAKSRLSTGMSRTLLEALPDGFLPLITQ